MFPGKQVWAGHPDRSPEVFQGNAWRCCCPQAHNLPQEAPDPQTDSVLPGNCSFQGWAQSAGTFCLFLTPRLLYGSLWAGRATCCFTVSSFLHPLYLASYALSSLSSVLQLPCVLYPASSIFHPMSCALHPPSRILYSSSSMLHPPHPPFPTPCPVANMLGVV